MRVLERSLWRARRSLAVLLALLLAGCLPVPATDEGARVADLYAIFMAAAALVFLIVAGLIAFVIVRYGARGTEARGTLPVQTRASMRLEVTWWVLPTLVVIGLFAVTAGVLARVDASAPDDALVVEVDGFRWGWRFTFPDAGVSVAGTAVDQPHVFLPLDRPVTFVLGSPDVVHSFFVPDFLVKRDTVPGQENRLTVTISEPGTYAGQCGEFCGLLHEQMDFEITAVPSDEFEAWLSEQDGATPGSGG